MRTVEDQEAELRGLEAMYPPPTDAEVWEDWFWLGQQSLRPDWKYWDVNVAALNKEIIGVGPHYLELRLRLAREYRVHPNRIAIICIEEYEQPWLEDYD